MKISVCIPTCKEEVNKQLEDIKKYISSEFPRLKNKMADLYRRTTN